MTPSIQSRDGDSAYEDQPVSSQPPSSEGENLSSQQQPAPSEIGNSAPTSSNITHGIETIKAMGNKIWRSLFPCLSLEEENIFKNGSAKDYEGVMNDISQYLHQIGQGEHTTDPNRQWPEDLSGLLKFLTTGRRENSCDLDGFDTLKATLKGATDLVINVLGDIGNLGYVTAGFHVITYGLEKFQDVSHNKKECLSILEEMFILNKLVKQCTERERLKEGMTNEIQAATELIMKGILTCLTQMRSSPFSKWLKSPVNKTELVEIRDDIDKKRRDIYFQMQISIVDATSVARRLSREYPKHAVGIETSIKEVTDLLEWVSGNNAVAVILYGFGGMGKTTVADAVFNTVNITNVEGKECKYSHVQLSSTPDIIELQKKILEDLVGPKDIPEIRKYQDGQREIGSKLAKVPAFIYIDNVLEKDQLRHLLPRNFDKALKVRLLITARDINVRKACRMTTPPKEYRMKGISSAGLKDFLKEKRPADANGPSANEIPLNMLKILSSKQVNRVTHRCGGIPLMLDLVAQELSHKPGICEIIESLERLEGEPYKAKLESYSLAKEPLDRRGICEVIEELEKWEGEEFGAKLESHFFVYDKLPTECKEAFLDICSFFKGWDWDTVADIVGKTALDGLERRALVAKGKNGVVTVHDVIMEVGQRKAKEMRIRFTSTSQLMNFLQEDEKVEQLRYLTYKPAKDLNQLILHNLRMPPKLKYMEIDGKLHCDDLEIFHSRLLRLPDLQILKLINFEGLKELPSVLGDLVKGLRELTLSNCKSFKELPYSISKLRSLRVLKMDHCQQLAQLPKELGSLNSLEILEINYCENLTGLPENLKELSSLRILNLSFCKALENLPNDLGNLTSLVNLNVSHCKSLDSIPESIANLHSLLSVDFSWCSSLGKLPDGFCSLSKMTYLNLTRCAALENLPGRFGQLQNLRTLKLKSCAKLKNLPEDFKNLKYLVHLDLSRCTELRELCINFNSLISLRTLSLDGCEKLEKLPQDFHYLYSLQHLNLSNCKELEGESMENVVKAEGLEMVYITGSDKLKEKWRQMPTAPDPPRSFKVDIEQDSPLEEKEKEEEEKEHEWEKLSPEFVRLLQNGQGEPFHLSNCSPNTTILLVMFDGCFDFNQDFPWPLIEETIDDIDDIQIDFEIIYIGKHFNKLPKRVADRISGRALYNSDARLLLEKVFFTLKRNGQSLWPQKMGKFFSMSTKIMNKGETEGRVEQNGDKYVSSWTLLSDCEMEKFVLDKCGRYIWLKKHAEKNQESNIQLLRELFENGGEDISLLRKSDKVGIDELKGKTILLEIRPADASYDIRLQSLKNLYIAEKDRSNLEIISIPVGQQNIGSKQFSGEIPWLVLQNPWAISRVVKYFLIKACEWEDKDGEISEAWYPSRMMKIELDSKVSYMPAVLAMLERWGPEAYPFSSGKIKELKEKEWNEGKKPMSSLAFLLKPFKPELAELKEVMRLQSKMICLICDGKHPRTQRVRTNTFVGCIKKAMGDVMDNIHFIYVPHYQEKEDNKLTVTDGIKVPHFPIEGSSMAELELKHLSSLQQWDAMRFWMRVCDLRKEIKGMDKNDKQLQGMERLLDSLDRGYLSMAVIKHDGEVVTSKGRQIVDIFDSIKDDEGKGSGKGKTKKVEWNNEDEFAGIKDEENESAKGTAKKKMQQDAARKWAEDMVKDVKEEGEEARKFVEYMIKGSEANIKDVWVNLENKLK